jgi:DNA-binding cell septation regulator SpoVG
MTGVEIIEPVRTLEPGSKVRLTATVRLGGVTIYNVRLVEGRSGPFVGLPSRKVDDRTWAPLVELSDSLRGRVLDALLAALTASAPLSDDGVPY